MDILNILKDLAEIKEEAAKKIEDIIFPEGGYLELIEENCDKVIVRKISISPALSEEDLEDGEILMEMHLIFYINDIGSKQIEELSRYGEITITDCHTNGSNVGKDIWCVRYTTSYCFEFDNGGDILPGKILSGSFRHCDE